ncbi:hypothetical protein ACJIZ3_006095 [Penstemon smallii]|uniref:Uncharacterized protein n=1 Tax=Penstemon smallii TaxID=265156 RepID=A0ABD3S6Q9_9LAMI
MEHLSEEEACLFAGQLAAGSVLPMVLKSAIELDLLELIKKAAGQNASASQLAAQLPTNNPDAATMIDRILGFLAAHSVVNCSLEALPNGSGGVERRYSLLPVSKFLTKNEDGVSLASISLMVHDRVLMDMLHNLKDAVLEGGIAFNRAHGMGAFEYSAIDPRYNKVFNKAMSEQSTILLKKIFELYNGFDGLNSLMDVGGGTGATINSIISKYPSIKGINFDLPHVIQDAPSYQGVEHIGGDMFVSLPKADAIFMKWICHDWSDAHCLKLLKNCIEALPDNGKVIIAESILSDDPKNEPNFLTAIRADVIMLALTEGGKERTEKEFETLAKEAGFKQLKKICCAFDIWIMELYK